MQKTQNLTLITLAFVVVVVRREEEPDAVFIQWGGDSIHHDYSPFSRDDACALLAVRVTKLRAS